MDGPNLNQTRENTPGSEKAVAQKGITPELIQQVTDRVYARLRRELKEEQERSSQRIGGQR